MGCGDGRGAVWAAVSGWAGFFAIGAFGVHAMLELGVRRNRRALAPLVVLLLSGGLLFVLDIVHVVWVLGGDLAYLGDVLWSRMGSGNSSSVGAWFGRVTELHWRYFGLTSVCALAALVYRGAQGIRLESPADAAVEVGSIFLLTGAAYVGVFNFSAGQHDYWQFFLLPASAIAITLAYRWGLSGLGRGRRRASWILLLLLMTFDIATTAVYTLHQRHHRTEAYCQRIVAEFRRDYL